MDRLPVKVHRCRFVEYVPSAVHAVAVSPVDTKPYLAVARENGNVEIYNAHNHWQLERCIPGSKAHAIESIAWAAVTEDAGGVEEEEEEEGDHAMSTIKTKRKPRTLHRKRTQVPLPRLFTAGLNGYITEWDISTYQPKAWVESFGGGVWCIAVDPSSKRLAAACEDGCIRLYDIQNGALTYMRSFGKQDGRLLTVAWHPQGRSLVSGSSKGLIRTWNAETGKPMQRMQLDASSEDGDDVDTIVWSVRFLASGVVVSGDSTGRTQFWDPMTGTLIQSFQSHQADVLCVESNATGDLVWSSGVDNKLCQFRVALDQPATADKKTITPLGDTAMSNSSNPTVSSALLQRIELARKRQCTWRLEGYKRLHSHDVRSMAWCDHKYLSALVTGGIDTCIFIVPPTELAKKANATTGRVARSSLRSISPYPQQPLIHMAPQARLFLSQSSRDISLWRLGNVDPTTMQATSTFHNGERLPIETHPNLPFQLSIPEEESNILCSGISPCGRWLCYSTRQSLKLFRLDSEDFTDPQYPIRAKKLASSSRILCPSHKATFTPDGQRLVLATLDGHTLIIQLLDGAKPKVLKAFRQGRAVGGEAASMSTEEEDVDMLDADGNVTTESKAETHDEEEDEDGAYFDLDRSCHSTNAPSSIVVTQTISADGQWLAVGDSNNIIWIYHLDSLQCHGKAPRFPAQHTALTFHPTDPVLVVACSSERTYTLSTDSASSASGAFYLYDLDAKALHPWSRRHAFPSTFPESWRGRCAKEPVLGVSFDPVRTSCLYLWTWTTICRVDLNEPLQEPVVASSQDGKKRRHDEEKDTINTASRKSTAKDNVQQMNNFHELQCYKPLLYFSMQPSSNPAHGTEMVVVERPWLSILATFPPAFQRPKYGAY